MMDLLSLPQRKPQAVARLQGSERYPELSGKVRFYPAAGGVWVEARVFGLPKASGDCARRFFAFHLHAGGHCTGNNIDPFADALGHYNPRDCPHPQHAGDLPPLLGTADGRAYLLVFTDRFRLPEIIGKTIIIHAGTDDFSSPPAGNAGERIACGLIKALGA